MTGHRKLGRPKGSKNKPKKVVSKTIYHKTKCACVQDNETGKCHKRKK